MVEALMVVMMNKSSMEPIPIEYNSTIMHILEAYNDLLNQIRDKDHAIHVLQQTHTKDVNDYEAIANAWCEKENEYKVEVKRLEILLSKTENGMETMFAARSNSVVHGSKRASESIKHGIGTIRARHSANSRDRTGTCTLPFHFLLFLANSFQTIPRILKSRSQHMILRAGTVSSAKKLQDHQLSTEPVCHLQVMQYCN
jgi:hypothetical protein